MSDRKAGFERFFRVQEAVVRMDVLFNRFRV